jgi:hypothetical protein
MYEAKMLSLCIERSSNRNSLFSVIREDKMDAFVKSKFPLPWREGMKGRGMDKELECFYSSLPPQPSPVDGEGVFFPFYDLIKIERPDNLRSV